MIEETVKWCCYMESATYDNINDFELWKLKTKSYTTRQYDISTYDFMAEQITIFDYNVMDSVAI
ncbi:hypothetical protein M4L90_12125 [Staphylococcus equorum]|uniref:Uncharacterized protein n=1 Tax=Staphylococcus equorum TaxID=246432 RepID=A0A9X4L6P7_9STAP|nr:hypothetical protein [Staphylococcus equorum]MDG0820666.1 hypothetical protein [Staphylococcus equorum]MDG0841291.1 hypothetical protein [Staphylococcus equorum]MDG0846991.1 hypothetical protein [Staphylococcus equorum]OEL08296.1 hypothetical protein AST04_08910 [Staphylococcus equorum]PTE82268.1 hypothetical protein BUY85_00595 [Staphylococcus equorum]